LAGRYVWPMWIGLDLLIALGLAALLRRSSLIMGAALLLIALPLLSGQTGHPPNSDFRGTFAYIQDHRQRGDFIILRDGTLFSVAEYYGLDPHAYVGIPSSQITDITHILHAKEAATILNHLSS